MTAASRRRGDLLAMTASWALLAAAFHPLHVTWLAWIAPLPWMVRHMDRRIPGEPRFGPVWMLGSYLIVASTLAWMRTLAPPLMFLVPLLGMPTAWLTGRLLDAGRARGVAPWFLYPSVIACCDVLRDRLLGLSWAVPGYTQEEVPSLLALAAVGRAHLVSWVMLCVAAAATHWWVSRGDDPVERRRARRGAAIAAGILLVAIGFGAARHPETTADGPLAVAVQPNVPQAERLREGPGRQAVIQAGILERFADQNPDLAVLPETCFPGVREPDERRLGYILDQPAAFSRGGDALVRFRDSTLRAPGQVTVLGVTVGQRIRPDDGAARAMDDDGDGYLEQNVAWVLTGGTPTASDVRYGKRILCPFGEYVPWPAGAPFRDAVTRAIERVGGYIPDLEPGMGPGIFTVRSPGGPRKGAISICFEAVFPEMFREGVLLGADFLVNVSNDAWFFDSEELDLVDVATRFRAVESGRTVLRVSNSGISTVFGPDGTRLAIVEGPDGRRKEVAGGFAVRLPICAETTPYVRFGDAPWALLGLVISWCCLRPRRAAPSRSGESG